MNTRTQFRDTKLFDWNLYKEFIILNLIYTSRLNNLFFINVKTAKEKEKQRHSFLLKNLENGCL